MDVREKLNIPEKFYRDSVVPPLATDVGELIDLLSELPRDLAVESDYEAAAQVKVLIGYDADRCWVQITDPDGCLDEDEDE